MTGTLSNDARAIAGGLFGLPPLRRHDVIFTTGTQVSPRAFAALRELVGAGVISMTVSALDVRYRALSDCREHYHWLRENRQLFAGGFHISTKG